MGSVFLRGKNSRLTEALQRLRKVLALERSRKFADTAVIGGLDAYLQHFLSEIPLPAHHRFRQVLHSLPSPGYRALHPVQRRRVVEELEATLAEPVPEAPSREVMALLVRLLAINTPAV